ncbi:hypothetical protein POM88_009176 [Heracleum sosnowskyi]|uniref:3-dehydroquinate synthase n=1 Tax=Heracleum sosnowskyi TaxID=360622 RepID=A0AAD8JA69_9APIA|nr:hypothetical protein POM88_009176 [Heracleum sosnowskyi]
MAAAACLSSSFLGLHSYQSPISQPRLSHSSHYSKSLQFESGRVQLKTASTKVVMHESTTTTTLPPSSSSAPAITTFDVNLGDRSYPIYIGSGLLDQPDLLQRHVEGKRVLVVTNTKVAPLYLDKVINALTVGNPNVSVESVILPDGEQYKNMDTLMKVYDKAIESRLDRRCTFVALGGRRGYRRYVWVCCCILSPRC